MPSSQFDMLIRWVSILFPYHFLYLRIRQCDIYCLKGDYQMPDTTCGGNNEYYYYVTQTNIFWLIKELGERHHAIGPFMTTKNCVVYVLYPIYVYKLKICMCIQYAHHITLKLHLSMKYARFSVIKACVYESNMSHYNIYLMFFAICHLYKYNMYLYTMYLCVQAIWCSNSCYRGQYKHTFIHCMCMRKPSAAPTTVIFLVLFDLILYVPSTIFQL